MLSVSVTAENGPISGGYFYVNNVKRNIVKCHNICTKHNSQVSQCLCTLINNSNIDYTSKDESIIE